MGQAWGKGAFPSILTGRRAASSQVNYHGPTVSHQSSLRKDNTRLIHRSQDLSYKLDDPEG